MLQEPMEGMTIYACVGLLAHRRHANKTILGHPLHQPPATQGRSCATMLSDRYHAVKTWQSAKYRCSTLSGPLFNVYDRQSVLPPC